MMGQTAGRIHNTEQHRKVTSSFSQDSDISLSTACSADFSISPSLDRKNVSFTDLGDTSIQILDDHVDSNAMAHRPPFGPQEVPPPTPPFEAPSPAHKQPPSLDYNGRVFGYSTPTKLLQGGTLGRASPGNDLGYHTLVTRQTPTPTRGLESRMSLSPWTDLSSSRSPSRASPFPSGFDIASLSTKSSPRLQQAQPQQTQVNGDTEQLLTTFKAKKIHKSSPFDRLPDAVILRIFSYLSTNELCISARVCRRWYFLVWEPQLWTSITITGENTHADRALKTLLRLLCRDSPNVCLTVEKVFLNGCSRLTDRGLVLLAKRCPELKSLELKGCSQITNMGIFDIVTKCTSIEHLDVTGCNQINCINLSRDPLHTRQLYIQYLDMTDCHGLEDAGLKLIVRSCPQLLHLYLRRCVNITDVGVKYVASYCMALKEFSVSDCVQVTDFGLYELAKLGPNLRYLSVAKCDRVSDAGVRQVARHCYKLRYLNVRGCEAVSDDAIEVLARSCPRLRALDLGKCDVTDAGLKMLAENCPNLKKLSVKSCELVTDRGVQYVAYYCRGLQQLNIQDCAITLDGYRTVKKFCKRCIIEHTNPGFC